MLKQTMQELLTGRLRLVDPPAGAPVAPGDPHVEAEYRVPVAAHAHG
ncbi:MAG TPA: hypothetical protein VE913_20355 [Longimicrobium sp.]|nr:hypothetical protein [Longimicrobium sp.]